MILDQIVSYTRERVVQEMKERPKEEYRKLADQIKNSDLMDVYPMEEALKRKGISFICEVKKASPSKGLIADEFDYIKIAEDYEKAGASAISVLTEPKFFLGSDLYLQEIHKNVSVPLLRKDFIVDEYQIYQAKCIGASCILLICSVLSPKQLKDYRQLADELGMSALVEVHDEKEIPVAIDCGARIIGVNNRNLGNFEVNIEHSVLLRERIPKNILFIAESGMKTPQDIKALYDANVDGVLIGETMMRSKNKTEKIRELKSLLPISKEKDKIW